MPRTPNSAGPGPCSTVQPRGASIPAITSPEAKIDGRELNIEAAFILKKTYMLESNHKIGFKFKESISCKEARACLYDVEYLSRDVSSHGHHHLRLLDNFGVPRALQKPLGGTWAAQGHPKWAL